MNIHSFIAKRITFSQSKSFTRLIINIGIAAIALSVTVLIVSSSLFTGFKGEISTKVFDFWGHIHISDAHVKRNFEPFPMRYDTALVERLESLEQQEFQVPKSSWFSDKNSTVYEDAITKGTIRAVSPFIVIPAVLDSKKEFEAIYLRGLNGDYPWERLDDFLQAGSWISPQDSLSTNEIVLSEKTLVRIQRKVGDQIIVNFVMSGKHSKKRLKIVGSYKTGIEEYDKQFGIVHLHLLQEALSWDKDQIAGYELVLDDIRDLSIWNEYIYVEELPSKMYSETIKEKFSNIFSWLSIQDVNERVIFFLMIIVAIITMITTYLILIIERTKTIGILKSLGATNKQVIMIFLHCAFFIIARGLLIGNVLGIGLCLIQKYTRVIQLDEANYLLDSAPIQFNIPMLLFINLGVLLITLIFLLVPSLLISKFKPVSIFRFN